MAVSVQNYGIRRSRVRLGVCFVYTIVPSKAYSVSGSFADYCQLGAIFRIHSLNILRRNSQ